MLHSGFTRLLHSVARPASTRTIPISVTLSPAAVTPVVSRSTKAAGFGNIGRQPSMHPPSALDGRTIVRYCTCYVERSFLPVAIGRIWFHRRLGPAGDRDR